MTLRPFRVQRNGAVDRELRQLESAGIIALAYSRIGLHDLDALRAAATDALA